MASVVREGERERKQGSKRKERERLITKPLSSGPQSGHKEPGGAVMSVLAGPVL